MVESLSAFADAQPPIRLTCPVAVLKYVGRKFYVFSREKKHPKYINLSCVEHNGNITSIFIKKKKRQHSDCSRKRSRVENWKKSLGTMMLLVLHASSQYSHYMPPCPTLKSRHYIESSNIESCYTASLSVIFSFIVLM